MLQLLWCYIFHWGCLQVSFSSTFFTRFFSYERLFWQHFITSYILALAINLYDNFACTTLKKLTEWALNIRSAKVMKPIQSIRLIEICSDIHLYFIRSGKGRITRSIYNRGQSKINNIFKWVIKKASLFFSNWFQCLNSHSRG